MIFHEDIIYCFENFSNGVAFLHVIEASSHDDTILAFLPHHMGMLHRSLTDFGIASNVIFPGEIENEQNGYTCKQEAERETGK